MKCWRRWRIVETHVVHWLAISGQLIPYCGGGWPTIIKKVIIQYQQILFPHQNKLPCICLHDTFTWNDIAIYCTSEQDWVDYVMICLRARDSPDQCLIDLVSTQPYSNSSRKTFTSFRTRKYSNGVKVWIMDMVSALLMFSISNKNGKMTEQYQWYELMK